MAVADYIAITQNACCGLETGRTAQQVRMSTSSIRGRQSAGLPQVHLRVVSGMKSLDNYDAVVGASPCRVLQLHGSSLSV